jgi:hypothetical protein
MDLPEKKKHLGRNIALVSALIIAIGSIAPFAGFDDFVVYGLQGDGKLTLAIGVIIIASLLFKKIPAYVNILFSSLALALAAFDYSRLSETTSSIKNTVTTNPYMTDVASSLQMGSGLQLIMIGAIGVIAGSVIHMLQKKNA